MTKQNEMPERIWVTPGAGGNYYGFYGHKNSEDFEYARADTVVSRTDYQAAVDTQKAIAMELLVQKKKYDKVLAVAKQMAGALEWHKRTHRKLAFNLAMETDRALAAFEQLEKEGV